MSDEIQANSKDATETVEQTTDKDECSNSDCSCSSDERLSSDSQSDSQSDDETTPELVSDQETEPTKKKKKKNKKKKEKAPYTGPVAFYPVFDVMNLAKIWTQHFHQHSITPSYSLVGTRRGNYWEVLEMMEPVDFKGFFRARVADILKQRYFYKAERANQELMTAQIFSNFCWDVMNRDANPLHYEGRRVVKIHLQWIKVTGHAVIMKSLFEGDMGMPLVDQVKAICLTGFEVLKDNENPDGDTEMFYLDFTSPQVDVYAWSEEDTQKRVTVNRNGQRRVNHNQGYPLLKVQADQLVVGQPYSEKHTRNVKVVAIEDSIEVDGNENYQAYLKIVDMENQKGGAVQEGEVDLMEYHETIYKDFRQVVKKQLDKEKKATKKKSNK